MPNDSPVKKKMNQLLLNVDGGIDLLKKAKKTARAEALFAIEEALAVANKASHTIMIELLKFKNEKSLAVAEEAAKDANAAFKKAKSIIDAHVTPSHTTIEVDDGNMESEVPVFSPLSRGEDIEEEDTTTVTTPIDRDAPDAVMKATARRVASPSTLKPPSEDLLPPLDEVDDTDEIAEDTTPAAAKNSEHEVNVHHSNFVHKSCDLVISVITRDQIENPSSTTAINKALTTASSRKQYNFDFATPLKKDEIRCFTLTNDTDPQHFSLGKFIYDQKSEKSGIITGDPGKYQITEFPNKKLSSQTLPPGLQKDLDKDLNRARVEFAVKMAMQIIAGKTPSKENPITLTGTNKEELRYLWTALVKLGKELPMRFDASAIQVNSSKFNPDEEKGCFGYFSKSLFKTVFQDYPDPVKQAVKDAKNLLSGAKQVKVEDNRHLFCTYKERLMDGRKKAEVVSPLSSPKDELKPKKSPRST